MDTPSGSPESGPHRRGADRQSSNRQSSDRQGPNRQGPNRQGPNRQSVDRQSPGRWAPTGRSSARGVVATVVGIVLSVLLVVPWPQNTPEPVVLGVMPAPLFFWLLWTVLFIGYIAWIAYVWDPYADIVKRHERAGRTAGTRGAR